MLRVICSAEEFDSLMRAVDAAMRRDGVSISARQLSSVSYVVDEIERNQLPYPIDSFIDWPFMRHIDRRGHDPQDWIEQFYGDRLKLDLSFAMTSVFLRDDNWVLSLPWLVGQGVFRCDVNSPPNPRLKQFGTSVPVLSMIGGLSLEMAADLSEVERKYIKGRFAIAYDVHRRLLLGKGEELLSMAKIDLVESSRFACGNASNSGLAMWHGAQAVEKILKAFIKSRAGNLEKKLMHHNLVSLAQVCESYGMVGLQAPLLDSVMCSPAVRYDATAFTSNVVERSQRACLEISSLVLKSL